MNPYQGIIPVVMQQPYMVMPGMPGMIPPAIAAPHPAAAGGLTHLLNPAVSAQMAAAVQQQHGALSTAQAGSVHGAVVSLAPNPSLMPHFTAQAPMGGTMAVLESKKRPFPDAGVGARGNNMGGAPRPGGQRWQISSDPELEVDDPNIDESAVVLDHFNSDLHLIIDPDGYGATTLNDPPGFCFTWAGARTTFGVNRGKAFFEVHILENMPVDFGDDHKESDPHVIRVGWSVDSASFQLGEEPLSYGYGGTGKFSVNNKFTDYGQPFGVGDVVGAMLDLDSRPASISFTKNGIWLGNALPLHGYPVGSKDMALFPHVLSKNCRFKVNFGQLDPWFPPPHGFQYVGLYPVSERIRGMRPPLRKADCEMIMIVGLPGAGKTTWGMNMQKNHPEKRYNIIGTDTLIEKMRVNGLPRRRNYHGRWDVLIDKATKCLNRLFSIASRRKRNYILDQTNVYASARRRKMKNFAGFQRIAAVLVPEDPELERRSQKRTVEDGKYVPETAVLEMKANFTLPDEKEGIFDRIDFVELPREQACGLVERYKKEGNEKRPDPSVVFQHDSRFQGGQMKPPMPGVANQKGLLGDAMLQGTPLVAAASLPGLMPQPRTALIPGAKPPLPPGFPLGLAALPLELAAQGGLPPPGGAMGATGAPGLLGQYEPAEPPPKRARTEPGSALDFIKQEYGGEEEQQVAVKEEARWDRGQYGGGGVGAFQAPPLPGMMGQGFLPLPAEQAKLPPKFAAPPPPPPPTTQSTSSAGAGSLDYESLGGSQSWPPPGYGSSQEGWMRNVGAPSWQQQQQPPPAPPSKEQGGLQPPPKNFAFSQPPGPGSFGQRGEMESQQQPQGYGGSRFGGQDYGGDGRSGYGQSWSQGGGPGDSGLRNPIKLEKGLDGGGNGGSDRPRRRKSKWDTPSESSDATGSRSDDSGSQPWQSSSGMGGSIGGGDSWGKPQQQQGGFGWQGPPGGRDVPRSLDQIDFSKPPPGPWSGSMPPGGGDRAGGPPPPFMGDQDHRRDFGAGSKGPGLYGSGMDSDSRKPRDTNLRGMGSDSRSFGSDSSSFGRDSRPGGPDSRSYDSSSRPPFGGRDENRSFGRDDHRPFGRDEGRPFGDRDRGEDRGANRPRLGGGGFDSSRDSGSSRDRDLHRDSHWDMGRDRDSGRDRSSSGFRDRDRDRDRDFGRGDRDRGRDRDRDAGGPRDYGRSQDRDRSRDSDRQRDSGAPDRRREPMGRDGSSFRDSGGPRDSKDDFSQREIPSSREEPSGGSKDELDKEIRTPEIPERDAARPGIFGAAPPGLPMVGGGQRPPFPPRGPPPPPGGAGPRFPLGQSASSGGAGGPANPGFGPGGPPGMGGQRPPFRPRNPSSNFGGPGGPPSGPGGPGGPPGGQWNQNRPRFGPRGMGGPGGPGGRPPGPPRFEGGGNQRFRGPPGPGRWPRPGPH